MIFVHFIGTCTELYTKMDKISILYNSPFEMAHHTSRLIVLDIFLMLIATALSGSHGAELNSEIAEGLCQNHQSYKTTEKLPPKLLRKDVNPKISKSWLHWTGCNGKSPCEPFTFPTSVRTRTKSQKPTSNNIIVTMRDQEECQPETFPCTNSSGCPAPSVSTRSSLAKSVMSKLESHAKKSQASVLNILKSKGRSLENGLPVTLQSLWITNQIIVQGLSLSAVQNMLQSNKDVLSVDEEHVFKLTGKGQAFPRSGSSTKFASWGIENIDAHKVWEKGINGSGILVGNIDTGVDISHEALKENFVGGDYGWFDAISYSAVPRDTGGHGSHVMGTMAGTAKNIGVAPGVKWMACRACGMHDCPTSALLRCGQWILCPTKTDGSDPDCSKAPHIVSNSWGDRQPSMYHNNTIWTRFEQIVKCWRSAGIIPVAGIGNDGGYGIGEVPATCGSAFYPGVSSQVIGVGNVEMVSKDNTNRVRVYVSSSLGPAESVFSQKIKPDVSAPGTGIVSSEPGGKYEKRTGTSMATPHVAGTVALMLQNNPALTYDGIKSALIKSCSPTDEVSEAQRNCDGITDSQYPNNAAGYGNINAYKAVFGCD